MLMAKKTLPDDIREFFAKQGARGGKIGGKMRMESLTAEERSALGRKAAAARKKKAKKKPAPETK